MIPPLSIEVALSSQPYSVLIGKGSLDQLGPLIRSRGVAAATKVLVVTNPVVEGFYGHRALESLRRCGAGAQPAGAGRGGRSENPRQRGPDP